MADLMLATAWSGAITTLEKKKATRKIYSASAPNDFSRQNDG
jgi:hypothetical protein